MLKMHITGFIPFYRPNILCFAQMAIVAISLNRCRKMPFFVAKKAIYRPIWSPWPDPSFVTDSVANSADFSADSGRFEFLKTGKHPWQPTGEDLADFLYLKLYNFIIDYNYCLDNMQKHNNCSMQSLDIWLLLHDLSPPTE